MRCHIKSTEYRASYKFVAFVDVYVYDICGAVNYKCHVTGQVCLFVSLFA